MWELEVDQARCDDVTTSGPHMWGLKQLYIGLFFLLLGGALMINGLVEIIQESLPFIVSSNQNHFIEKYEVLALLYDRPSLDTSCKYYYCPNIKF